jgi:hypothetical protein
MSDYQVQLVGRLIFVPFVQTRIELHLYVNYLVEKINKAQDLGLAPEVNV